MKTQVYITTLNDTYLLDNKIHQAISDLKKQGFEVKLYQTSPASDEPNKQVTGDVLNFDLEHSNYGSDNLSEIYVIVSKVLENAEIIALSIVVLPGHSSGYFGSENYNREYIAELLQEEQEADCKRNKRNK